MYYKNANAIFLMYDITRESSFNRMVSLIQELKNKGPKGAVLVLAGTKTDLESKRVVSREKVESVAKDLTTFEGTPFKDVLVRECSSKTGEGVKELFQAVCESLVFSSSSFNDNES